MHPRHNTNTLIYKADLMNKNIYTPVIIFSKSFARVQMLS